jgi:hypothetical protein
MVLGLDESIAQIGFLVQIAAPEMDMPGTEPGLANQHAVIERLQSNCWSYRSRHDIAESRLFNCLQRSLGELRNLPF